MNKGNFYVVIESNNKEVAEKWFENYEKALQWADSFDLDQYKVTVFDIKKDEQVLKYEKVSMFSL